MSVRRSLAWAYSGQIMSFGIQFATSIIIARILSPHEMGIYAIATAVQGIIWIFTNFGIGAYIVREVDLKRETLDTAFTVNAILSFILAGLLLGASFGGKLLFGDPGAANVLRVSAVSVLIPIFAFRASVMMQREMRFKEGSMIGTATGVISSLSTISFALLGASYMSPAYGALVGNIVSTLAVVILIREHFSTRISFAEWRRLSVFGMQIMSVGGVSNMAARLSDVILGRMLGVTALGFYSRASNLSGLIFDQVYGTATRVAFVQLSQTFRETGELREMFLRSFKMITACLWPFLIGLAVLSRPAIHILYGEKWVPAAVPLSLLMIAQFFTLCFGMNWELFVLRDETARQTRYEVIRSIIGLVVFSIGCLISIEAAAVGRIIDAFVGFLFYYPHVRRLAGTERHEIPAIYRDSGLLTVAAVLPALVLMIVYRWSSTTPPVLVALCVLGGVALWLLTALRLRHPLRDELLRFVTPVMPRLGAQLERLSPR